MTASRFLKEAAEAVSETSGRPRPRPRITEPMRGKLFMVANPPIKRVANCDDREPRRRALNGRGMGRTAAVHLFRPAAGPEMPHWAGARQDAAIRTLAPLAPPG